MTDEPTCDYVMWVGNRRMIKRRKLDEYLENAYSVLDQLCDLLPTAAFVHWENGNVIVYTIPVREI